MASRIRRRVWVGVLLLALLVIVGTVILPAALQLKGRLRARATTRFRCTICDADKTTETITIARITVRKGTVVTPSKLTEMRTRLIGVCTHDWVMDWSTSASGLHADWFPSREHPACGLTRSDLDVIERLPDDAARVKVLQALGDRENLLKWFAYDSVWLTAALLEDDDLAQLDWAAWWHEHAWTFDIYHDREAARQAVLAHPDWKLGMAAHKSSSLLGLGGEEPFSASGGQ